MGNFAVKKLCSNCPFKRGQGYLTKSRAREIGTVMATGRATFSCHKTVEHDEEGEPINRGDELHCIGALAFAMNTNAPPSQMERIAGRMGAWNPAEAEVIQPEVYKTLREMIAAHGGR